MPEPLKNMFNRHTVSNFADAFQMVYPDFDRQAFFERVFDAVWETLELKERMRHITMVLHDLLPLDYPAALTIVRKAAAQLKNYSFEVMVFPDFVEVYGLNHWNESMPALEQFTQMSSSEFAVRPFILRDPERMMAQMLAWSQHENHHVRRLSSEGCRPRLPWAMALPVLKKDPSPILPILENLKQDESEYVRRSVANNLNDIAKDNPQVVIELLRRWREIDTPDMKKLMKQALRTLVKAGHPDALELLGYNGGNRIRIQNMALEQETVSFGDSLAFSFDLESVSDEPQNLVIDYVVYFQKANGSLAPKVFKLAQKMVAPGEVVHLRKKHALKPITTRVYYPGEHAVELKINGNLYERRTFELKMP